MENLATMSWLESLLLTTQLFSVPGKAQVAPLPSTKA